MRREMMNASQNAASQSKAPVAGVRSRPAGRRFDEAILSQGQNEAAQQYFQQAFDIQFGGQLKQPSAGPCRTTCSS